MSTASVDVLVVTPPENFQMEQTAHPRMTNIALVPQGIDGHSPARPLSHGIYVPTVAFFDEVTENLDHDAISKHAVRMAQAGVAGIAVQGSNGEAAHLTHEERHAITQTTRLALEASGFSTMPLIVGCGAQSTRETIVLCHEARNSGGDYALVLPPSYYSSLFATNTVREFFTTVADASPIPIILYNFPGGASGVDLSSDDIIALGQHRNIVGCKFT